MIVLPETEDRTIVSTFIWTKHGNVTDAGSPWLLQRSELQAMWTRCKNIVRWH